MPKFGKLGQFIYVQRKKAMVALGLLTALAVMGVGSVFGAFSASVSSTGNQFSTSSDLTAPNIARAVLRKSYGGQSGFVGCGLGGCSTLESRQFYIYAQVTDTGSPAVGVQSVDTTVGGANATLTTAGGPWTVDGQSFNYRSGFLTRSAAQLASGSRSYTIAAKDLNNNNANGGPYAFEVDTTQPQPTSIALANGGSALIPDSGDTMTYNFDSAMDPSSMFGNWTASGPPIAYTRSWTGASTPVVIHMVSPNKYGGDLEDPIRITVNDAGAGTPVLNAGQARVLADNWSIKCEATFNGTAATATGNTQVVVTLGSQTTSGQIIQPRPMSPTAEVC